MLRRSQLVPLEIFSPLPKGPFESEPLEVAWAREAIAYIYVDEIKDGAELDIRAQVSVDGQRWIDFGPEFDTMREVGGYFLQLGHFGTWLRLVGQVSGGPDEGYAILANFYWDLKE